MNNCLDRRGFGVARLVPERHGESRQGRNGTAGLVAAWQCIARRGSQGRDGLGPSGLVWARHLVARQARRGLAGQGWACLGKAVPVWLGVAGGARPGVAALGAARQGRWGQAGFGALRQRHGLAGMSGRNMARPVRFRRGRHRGD